MNALLSTARTLTGAATNVATTGLRTGLAVTTLLTLGVRRLLRPDATAPPAEPIVPDPVVPGPGEPVVPDPGDPGPPPPMPDPAPEPEPATPGMATPKPKPKPRKRAADVPLKSEPTPASAAPPEPEGPEVPAEELGTDGATGLAEPEPLLDDATAKEVLAEAETLRKAAQ